MLLRNLRRCLLTRQYYTDIEDFERSPSDACSTKTVGISHASSNLRSCIVSRRYYTDMEDIERSHSRPRKEETRQKLACLQGNSEALFLARPTLCLCEISTILFSLSKRRNPTKARMLVRTTRAVYLATDAIPACRNLISDSYLRRGKPVKGSCACKELPDARPQQLMPWQCVRFH